MYPYKVPLFSEIPNTFEKIRTEQVQDVTSRIMAMDRHRSKSTIHGVTMYQTDLLPLTTTGGTDSDKWFTDNTVEALLRVLIHCHGVADEFDVVTSTAYDKWKVSICNMK